MDGMTTSMVARPAPRWRSYVLEAKCELLRLLREPAFGVPVIAFPAFFYVLFGVLLNRGNAGAAEYLLATYGVFGVVGAAMFGFGVTIAIDREQGFLRLKRALPTPTGAPLLAKMAMAMVFCAVISLVLALLAVAVAGVRLSPGQWALLLVVNVLGSLPFAAIGLYIGTLVGGNAAPAVLNLIYLPMAFLSGLWLPLTMLPAIFGKLAALWPAYHLGQAALKVVGHDAGQPLWLHVVVLLVVTVVFAVLAQRRLSAAE
ncbi:ABC transporter permease [Luteimonas aestuarii]|uniref:ABC transporter permease n=1 Tax=Luteimonas aestuarii TaxID=453837 RepID=A0A4R5TTQ9_9GAMM|nr:ABC transporter permease [Luteimonas aestuarii]TDK24404.1 ABC transporter permease [Luteimonas aestuarii]